MVITTPRALITSSETFRNILKYVGFRFHCVLCPLMSAPISVWNSGGVACLVRTHGIVDRLAYDRTSFIWKCWKASTIINVTFVNTQFMHNSHAIDNNSGWLSGCYASVRYALSSNVGCPWYTAIAVAWNKFLPSRVSTWLSVLSTQKRRFFADEDLSAHNNSQRLPPCSAAFFRLFELCIAWLFVWNANFRLLEDFW